MNTRFQYELLSDEGYSSDSSYSFVDERVPFELIEPYIKLIFDTNRLYKDKDPMKLKHPHISTIEGKLPNDKEMTVVYHTDNKYSISYIKSPKYDYESIVLETDDLFIYVEMSHGHPAIHTNTFSYGNSDGSGYFFNTCDTNYNADDLLESLIINLMNYSNDRYH